MIEHEIMKDEGILVVRPVDKLTEEDFAGLTAAVDPYIEEHGGLTGLLIAAASFPGWEDFAGFTSHMRFVKDHHKAIQRVALATDAGIPSFIPKLVDHFTAAEIKPFAYAERDAALAWLKGADA